MRVCWCVVCLIMHVHSCGDEHIVRLTLCLDYSLSHHPAYLTLCSYLSRSVFPPLSLSLLNLAPVCRRAGVQVLLLLLLIERSEAYAQVMVWLPRTHKKNGRHLYSMDVLLTLVAADAVCSAFFRGHLRW